MKQALPSTLRVDLIGPEEAERLSRLARQAYYDHFPYLWEDGGKGYVQATFSVDRLSRELADPLLRYYLACRDRQPAGYMKLRPDAPLDNYNNALELERIYLLKAAAGQGIGKQLVQRCFEVAHALRKEVVWLKVMSSSENSIAFYEKLGFIKHADTVFSYPRLKPNYQAMYVMKKMMKHEY